MPKAYKKLDTITSNSPLPKLQAGYKPGVMSTVDGEMVFATGPVKPITSGGAANAATVPGLKRQITTKNLTNIAAQDSRLALAVNGKGNFSIGIGTEAEANTLGKVWVGDGARLVSNQVSCPGCLVSADGARIYRPPQPKSSSFATTGIQANFVQQTSTGQIISNGHLNVLP